MKLHNVVFMNEMIYMKCLVPVESPEDNSYSKRETPGTAS